MIFIEDDCYKVTFTVRSIKIELTITPYQVNTSTTVPFRERERINRFLKYQNKINTNKT